ncbi:hypothetical protein Pmani_020747 [Petrolisthes manimaculis]|uniref:PLAC domain-containing protein n=1 Tax=Petrolisthes manimaculis TaxID=1843537 RepID=A0AAE1PHS2_9EUCA|nr:hypothetical protein Pmani_020747 [Petrolisthes manimaculis]
MLCVLLLVVVSGVVTADQVVTDEILLIPDTDKIVQQLEEAMKRQLKRSERLLVTEMATLDGKIGQLTQELQHVKDSVASINPAMVDATNEVKGELGTVKAQVSAMLTQVAALATHEDLIALKTKMATLISSLAKEDSLARILKEVLSEMLQEVSLKVDEVKETCDSCGQAAGGCERLREGMKSLVAETLSTRDTQVNETINRLQLSVDGIQEGLHEIANYTRPKTIPEVHETETRTQYPCEDSNFVFDEEEFDVCATSVRFKRCQIQTLAYHCCRSCTDSGQIPEDGPWRYMNYSRTVTRLTASQLLTP